MTSVTAAAESAPLSSVAAARIRGLRAEAGLNQTELARQVGLSRTAISDREAGVKPVNVDELPILAAVLGTSIEYLLGLTNDRTPRPEVAEGISVRHQGLEPRTRWFSVSSETRGRHLSVVSSGPTNAAARGHVWVPRIIDGERAS